jgi:hypothetical protein
MALSLKSELNMTLSLQMLLKIPKTQLRIRMDLKYNNDCSCKRLREEGQVKIKVDILTKGGRRKEGSFSKAFGPVNNLISDFWPLELWREISVALSHQ